MKLLPTPTPLPLSRQVENVLLVVLLVGMLCAVPSLFAETSDWARELLLVAAACMICILLPLVYSVVQGIRWILQNGRV